MSFSSITFQTSSLSSSPQNDHVHSYLTEHQSLTSLEAEVRQQQEASLSLKQWTLEKAESNGWDTISKLHDCVIKNFQGAKELLAKAYINQSNILDQLNMDSNEYIKKVIKSCLQLGKNYIDIATFENSIDELLMGSSTRFFGSGSIIMQEAISANTSIQNTTQLANAMRRTVERPQEYAGYKKIALQIVSEFVKEPIKSTGLIDEACALAEVGDQDINYWLLKYLLKEVEKQYLFYPYILDGLARVIHFSKSDAIKPQDLLNILKMLVEKRNAFESNNQQESIHFLTALSALLNAIVDANVAGVSYDQQFIPLFNQLNSLSKSGHRAIKHQATFALQALIRIKHDTSKFQLYFRRLKMFGEGAVALVKAVKEMNPNELVKAFKAFQQFGKCINQSIEMGKTLAEQAKAMYEQVTAARAAIKQIKSTKEPQVVPSVDWYQELRYLELLIDCEQYEAFEKIVLDDQSKSRSNIHFVWHIIRLLKHLLAKPSDVSIHIGALRFLQQIIQDGKEWCGDLDTQKEILTIFKEEGSRPELRDAVASIIEDLKKILSPASALSLQRYLFDVRELTMESKPLPSISTFLFDKAFTNKSLLETEIPGLITLIKTHLFPEQLESVVAKHKMSILSEKPDFYIAGKGKKKFDDTKEPAVSLFTICSEFMDSTDKVLLLLGDSGSGKSSFGLSLERDLWQTYQPGGTIPLFIPLAYLASKDPLHDLIKKVLEDQGYLKPHYNELRKKQRPLLVILDGYDEIGTRENLYVRNKLSEWNAKVIITCRLEYLQGRLEGHNFSFCPNVDGQLQSKALTKCYMSGFSADQIKDYLINFIKNHREGVWENWKNYITYINKYKLSELVENPYLLYIVATALPAIVETHQKKNNSEFQKLTRADLYDKFIELWINRGLGKIVDQEILGLIGDFPDIKFKNFIQDLAIAMDQNNSYEIEKDMIRSLRPEYKNDKILDALLQESPIKPVGKSSNTYSFLHSSLRDFLANKAAFDEISENAGISTSLQSVASQKAEEMKIDAIPLVAAPVAIEDQNRSIENERFRDMVLNKINICNRYEAIKLWLDQLETNPKRQTLIDKLRGVLYLSMKDEELVTAAANAITILIASGEVFSDEDLSHVKIRGANLNGGIFDHTIFRHADLREVSFEGAWLRKADFSHAKMAGVDFGENFYIDIMPNDKLFAYSEDFLWIAVVKNSSDIWLFNSKTRSLHCIFEDHSDLIHSLEFGPDNLLASASDDGTVKLWEVKEKKCLGTLKGHSRGVYKLAFGNFLDLKGAKRAVLASSSFDKTIRIWDLKKMTCLQCLEGIHALLLKFSPNNLWVASFDDLGKQTLNAWDLNMKNIGSAQLTHKNKFFQSGPNNLLALYGSDNEIEIFDISRMKIKGVLRGHSEKVNDVTFGSQNLFASGGADNTVRVWDLHKMKCISILRGHEFGVNHLIFGQNDLLVSASCDGKRRFWDWKKKKCIHVSENCLVTIMMHITPDNRLCSIHAHGMVSIFNVERIISANSLSGHQDVVNSIAFGPNNLIASGSDDKTVKLWDLTSKRCLNTFEDHIEKVKCVAFSSEGFLASLSGEAIKIRDLNGKIITNIVFKDFQHVARRLVGAALKLRRQLRYGDKEFSLDFLGFTSMAFGQDNLLAILSYSTFVLWDVKENKALYFLDKEKLNLGEQLRFSPNNLLGFWSSKYNSEYERGLLMKCDRNKNRFKESFNDIEQLYCNKENEKLDLAWEKLLSKYSLAQRNQIHSDKDKGFIPRKMSDVSCMAFSTDHFFAIGTRKEQASTKPHDIELDNTSEKKYLPVIELWDMKGKTKLLHTFEGYTQGDYVNVLAFSSTNLLAAGSISGDFLTKSYPKISLWDTKSYLCLTIIKLANSLTSLSWQENSSGIFFATGGTDNAIRYWQVLQTDTDTKVVLRWSSYQNLLSANGVDEYDVQGLETINRISVPRLVDSPDEDIIDAMGVDEDETYSSLELDEKKNSAPAFSSSINSHSDETEDDYKYSEWGQKIGPPQENN